MGMSKLGKVLFIKVFFKFFESEKLKDSEYNKTAIIY